jgi:chitinase domain-containing protein 1
LPLTIPTAIAIAAIAVAAIAAMMQAVVLLVSLFAYGSALKYPVCQIGPALQHLASKAFTVPDVLLSSTRSRSCFPEDAPKQQPLSVGEVTLVYVTPWNKDGYGQTLLHANKLTHVSPVWCTLKITEPKGGFNDGKSSADVVFEGEEGINTTWLQALPNHIQVVPRFQVQFDKSSTLRQVLFFPRDEMVNAAKKMAGMLAATAKRRAYDGLVLELPASAMPFKTFIQTLSSELKRSNKLFILVIPAEHGLGVSSEHQKDDPAAISRKELQILSPFIDLFSLVSYDHSSSTGREIGNSPVRWLQRILDKLTGINTQQSGKLGIDGASSDDDLDFDDDEDEEQDGDDEDKRGPDISRKILLGIPFYGFTMTSDGTLNTITKTELMSLLQFSMNGLRLNWIDADKEHVFDMPIWRIWFTSVLGLLWRVNIARERVGGVAIWDGGQGLDVYYDVL